MACLDLHNQRDPNLRFKGGMLAKINFIIKVKLKKTNSRDFGHLVLCTHGFAHVVLRTLVLCPYFFVHGIACNGANKRLRRLHCNVRSGRLHCNVRSRR